MVVKDSEEATLHCSIRGYHIYSYVEYVQLWKFEHAVVCARVHAMQVDTESMIKSMIATL